MGANVLFAGIGTLAAVLVSLRAARAARWAPTGSASRGEPPALTFHTGESRRPLRGIADLATYDVVVLQQPRGNAWLRRSASCRPRGARVLFEVDDYAHGVRKAKDHAARRRRSTRSCWPAMELDDARLRRDHLLDGLHRRALPRVQREHLGLPERASTSGATRSRAASASTVTIGWAGGTAHRPALLPWLRELLATCMRRSGPHALHERRRRRLRAPFAERFGAERAIGLPLGADRGLPGGDGAPSTSRSRRPRTAPSSAARATCAGWRPPRSASRSSPIPSLYPDDRHGVTGLHAATPAQARAAMLALVDDAGLRARIGAAARAHVREHRSQRGGRAAVERRAFEQVRRSRAPRSAAQRRTASQSRCRGSHPPEDTEWPQGRRYMRKRQGRQGVHHITIVVRRPTVSDRISWDRRCSGCPLRVRGAQHRPCVGEPSVLRSRRLSPHHDLHDPGA